MNRTIFIGTNLYYSQEFVDDIISKLKEKDKEIESLNRRDSMKKFIKIESNFKDNKEGANYDLMCNINNVNQKELMHWLGNFLQGLLDNNAFSYDTLLKVVKYAVVDPKKDREEEYSKNIDNLVKECTADIFEHIEDMLSEGKNDNQKD